jgi:hypothetical protein
MPPGLLIDGECKTCNNNRNKCFHTVVYKKGQITSFLSHTTSDGPPALMFNLEPYMHAYTHTRTNAYAHRLSLILYAFELQPHARA